MLKKPLLCLLSVLFVVCLQAQPNLQVQGTGTDLFLNHAVEAKETWYSMGRLYNLAPKDIGAFNNKDINAGLSVGQAIKIPLTTANFTSNETRSAEEVLVPVYHTVKEGEWMFRISTNYKTPIESLEKWNKITRNQVKAGMTMIVGHLRVKKDQSALATANPSSLAGNVAKPATTTGGVAGSTPGNATVSTPTATNNTTSGNPATVATPPATSEPLGTGKTVSFNGGYFKTQFGGGGKTTKGVANVFRSTSGWNDGKYYALMDDVPVGTIVMITNASTSKSVYAKVLGSLSDIRENAGLAIRVSNAAAAELGSGDAKFTAEVKY